LTDAPEILRAPAPRIVDFGARRAGELVEILIAVSSPPEAATVEIGVEIAIDLETARAWRASLDAAIGSGMARTATPHF